MDNMKLYEQARSVPDEAKKPITTGRLKGMTDVNPMYRIKRLTEMFGPCGIGWWYEVTNRQLVNDEITHQRAAFVDIMLYYVDPETGAPTHGIPGTGGASFVSQERNGPYLSDECFKMALTDALSVACKAIGIAADVYWDKDRTKYTSQEDIADDAIERAKKNDTNIVKDGTPKCERCGKVITGWVDNNGRTFNATAVIKRSHEKYNGCYCANCMTEIAATTRKKVS